MIPSPISSRFSQSARNRGRDYVEQRRVQILSQDADQIVARVRGTSRYDVVLRLDSKTVVGACTCPYFDGGSACKHLWATLLEADRVGFLTKGMQFDLDWEAPGVDIVDLDDLDDAEAFEAEQFLFEGLTPQDRVQAREPHTPALERPVGRARPGRIEPPPPPTWLELLAHTRPPTPPRVVPRQQLWYVLSQPAVTAPTFGLTIVTRERKMNGDWGKPRSASFVTPADPADAQIVGLLRGSAYYYPGSGSPAQFHLGPDVWDLLLPLLCRTGRCSLGTASGELGPPIEWDDGPPWTFGLDASLSEDRQTLLVKGVLVRDDERRLLDDALWLMAGGLVVWPQQISRLQDHGAFPWITLLARRRPLPVPVADFDRFLEETTRTTAPIPLGLPEGFSVTRRTSVPKPRLHVRAPKMNEYPHDQLKADLKFDYDGVIVDEASEGHGVWLSQERAMVVRDRAAEAAATEPLAKLGVRPARYAAPNAPRLEIRAKDLPRAARELTAAGWHVEADGRLYRKAGAVSMAVTSGIDWFELHGTIDFDGMEVSLPAVWKAVSRGETMVTLGDGTMGILPEDWLARHGLAASLGDLRDDHVRFTRSQVGIVDAWLSDLPPIDCDAAFEQARGALREFDGLVPRNAGPAFRGELRPYQRDALGWLAFLEQFSFGGCLADDMGLGKTVQVLAHLDARRASRDEWRPSLVVVPRSLVFNWMEEAARFTPALRVLDHTSTAREREAPRFDEADIVLVTYGTLRRDIERLKDVRFDYVVLDEAQAIKNPTSESAKVVRLLACRHRLALTGTPVQNHLGELWSLFEFLNPGMLGAARAFGQATGRKGVDDGTRADLARAIRPFVLRRTKEAVAPELPARTEQIVHCAMDTAQRKVYEGLLTHYRASVGRRIAANGLAKSKMHVLEALLRLRQAACHPGLVSDAHAAAGSAKLEVLFSRLGEVVDEGHKALVFSQFTSLLAFVRRSLDERGTPYAYLDGQTRNREACVKEFQEDEHVRLFLVSLKAGGLGLNLTAADYVFLLDPWWNPAIEAQAIDRAHRIGQTRPVVAYRLIARDTVEEKILLLQDQKRALSASIIPSDDGLVKQLTEADLDFLFR